MKALAPAACLLLLAFPSPAAPAYEVVGAWTFNCGLVTLPHRGGYRGEGLPYTCVTDHNRFGREREISENMWPGMNEYAELRFRARKPGLDHYVEGELTCHHNAMTWDSIGWDEVTPPADPSALAARSWLEKWHCAEPGAVGPILGWEQRNDGRWCSPLPPEGYDEMPTGRLQALTFEIAPAQAPASRDRPYLPPYFGASCRYGYRSGQYADLCIGSVNVAATFGDEAAESVAFRTYSYIAPDGRPGRVGSSRPIERVRLHLGTRKTPGRPELGWFTHQNQSNWTPANRAAVRRFVRSLYRHERVALSFTDDYGRLWEWEVSMRAPSKGKPPHWETTMRRQAAYCLTNEPASD